MDEAVSPRQGIIVETGGFGAKEDCGFRGWGGNDDFTDRIAKVEAGDSEATLAGSRGKDSLAIGNRLVDVVVDFCVFEDAVRIGGRGVSTVIGPAITRSDKSQIFEAAIEHGAGAHADIFAELGLDEDDNGLGRGRREHIRSRCVTAP